MTTDPTAPVPTPEGGIEGVRCHQCGDPYWLCMDNTDCAGDFGDHNDDLVCAGCRRGNCRGACQR